MNVLVFARVIDLAKHELQNGHRACTRRVPGDRPTPGLLPDRRLLTYSIRGLPGSCPAQPPIGPAIPLPLPLVSWTALRTLPPTPGIARHAYASRHSSPS